MSYYDKFIKDLNDDKSNEMPQFCIQGKLVMVFGKGFTYCLLTDRPVLRNDMKLCIGVFNQNLFADVHNKVSCVRDGDKFKMQEREFEFVKYERIERDFPKTLLEESQMFVTAANPGQTSRFQVADFSFLGSFSLIPIFSDQKAPQIEEEMQSKKGRVYRSGVDTLRFHVYCVEINGEYFMLEQRE